MILMRSTDTPVYQPLPSPIIESHLKMVDATLQPLVDDLSKLPAFISTALFVKDQLYQHEASTVSIVSAPHIHNEDIAFMDSSIRKRRVDLKSTALGQTFVSHESRFAVSKMNPAHLTFGIYAEPHEQNGAVLQLAFDRKIAQHLHEETVTSIIRPYLSRIWATSSVLITESMRHESLANELFMDVPATPNSYAIKWDIVSSTELVSQHYAVFRHYLRQFTGKVVELADTYNARVTSHQGDSQDIIITIPPEIDRSNLRLVGRFGREEVLPFVQHITTLHNHIAQQYPVLSPKIRIGVGLGYTEQLQTDQTTGPVFWEIAALFKAHQLSELTFNQTAKIVLNF